MSVAGDALIVETARRVLEARCDAALVNAAEDGDWPAALWQELESLALPVTWVPDAMGGPGASLADGFAVAREGARHAVPLPLAETLLASWLLARTDLTPPPGPLAVIPSQGDGALEIGAGGGVNGDAAGVPFADVAGHLVGLAQEGGGVRVALFARDDVSVQPGRSLAGEPAGVVLLRGAVPRAVSAPQPPSLAAEFERMGALMRAQQMAGALSSVLEQALDYSRTRHQFGRPIARFQAVAHALAVLAGEVSAASAAADAGVAAVARHGIETDLAFVAVASAKIRSGQAAGAGAAIAHQVHGAIGFTREYSLQQRTRRLWSWRDGFGSESRWAIALGRHIAAGGAARLWPTLTALD